MTVQAPSEPQAPQPLKITLPVEGMTCAACQANVQRALTSTPGVAKAAVNLMTHEATVHYDPSATDPSKLVAAINDTGYVSQLPDASISTTAADDEREQSQVREYNELRRKSLVSLVLGAIAMVASMPLDAADGPRRTLERSVDRVGDARPRSDIAPAVARALQR
jgi:P-type Cu+ transporter